MNYMGNIYFYFFILVILIFLIAIFIANAIYFTDIYDANSEKTSSSQFQNLIFLNIAAVILLFISLFLIFYLTNNNYSYFENDEKIILYNETNKFNNNIKNLEKMKELKSNKDSLFFE